MKVNILDAKNRLSSLIKRVQAGEEVVIANRGEPVAQLVPVGRPGPAGGTGSARAILDWIADHPLPPHARRTADEIDAAVEAERAAWD